MEHPKEPGGINGGMYERGDEVSKTPVVVIEVASCEKRIEDVKTAGGQVLMGPQPVGDMGIYAQVKDSEDNIIGLWQPLGPSGGGPDTGEFPAAPPGRPVNRTCPCSPFSKVG